MTELTKVNDSTNYDIMEKVITEGDLSKLSSKERIMYYNKTCESMGLNPLTRPFEYVRLSGKMTLYARKDATEQLRQLHKISIYNMTEATVEGVFIVTAYAENATGKKDIAKGAVTIKGLQGEALANAMMKAETKAKRRVTLSICGLGWTDESEISSIPDAKEVEVDYETGEIKEAPKQVNRAAAHREQLKQEILDSTNEDELRRAYTKAYKLHHGDLEAMKDLTELKEKQKHAIKERHAKLLANHGAWLDEATDVQVEVIKPNESQE